MYCVAGRISTSFRHQARSSEFHKSVTSHKNHWRCINSRNQDTRCLATPAVELQQGESEGKAAEEKKSKQKQQSKGQKGQKGGGKASELKVTPRSEDFSK